jgi:hypothetical protein
MGYRRRCRGSMARAHALAAQSRKRGTIEGAMTGFRSGADDVTAVSILDKPNPMVLVGRASGYLQLLSIDKRLWAIPCLVSSVSK